MKNIDNLRFHLSRKSRISKLSKKVNNSTTSFFHEPTTFESSKKMTFSSSKKEENSKTEDRNEVKKTRSSRSVLQKRPSSVSENRRNKVPEKEQHQRASTPVPKSISKITKTENQRGRKSPERPKFKFHSKSEIPFPESLDSGSLLSLAVHEEELILKMLRMARERLRKKLIEKSRSKSKGRELMGDCTSFLGEGFSSPRDLNSFKDSYSCVLDEVFRAWMNLFYFVVNLRINLIKTLNLAEAEEFEPNVELEKKIIIQAIECVKFFSKLKIKSLWTLADGIHSSDSDLTESQIKDYEEKASTPFLHDLDYIEKKAKELLMQFHRRKS